MQEFTLRHGPPEIQRLFLTDRFRDGLVDQLIKAFHAQFGQHFVHLLGGGADMTPVGKVVRKIVGWFKSHSTLHQVRGRPASDGSAKFAIFSSG